LPADRGKLGRPGHGGVRCRRAELQLQDAQEKEPFLIVRAAAAANAVSAEAGPLDGREFQLVGSSGTIQYSAWFRTDGEFALSLDRVRYMLLPLTDLASGN